MPTTLLEVVSDPNRRREVVDDCVRLIEAEVAGKRGVTGMAVKAGFKTVKKFRPGMIPMAMDHLLDDFARQIDPIWAECLRADGSPRDELVRRKVEVAEALLAITDARAERSPHRVLVRTYRSLRPMAVDHIGQAMPRLADLLLKYAS